MLTPFAYSMDKEKMSGFNDDVHFQVNNRHKVNVQKYFDFAVQNQPDFIVSPCEQVTFTSGKQKRKRSQKAALKNFINFQKIVKQEDKNQMLLMPILLGDKDGLDNYEMRQIQQRFIDEDEDKSLYYQVQPAAYSEMKQFFNTMPKEKIRAHHGMGTPVDVLNGIISGIDLFESDYPLTMAERGIAILIEDVKIQRKEESQQGEDRDDYLFLEMSKMMQKKDQRTLVLSKEENKTSEEKLVKECECYTCKNYNRGYLYHLLEVKEMNANILIAIHNVHQYHRMFENIRENFDDLEGYFKEYVKVNCVDIEESQLVSNENA
ncbi:queuine trna-ribosyltransferase subunit qtrtd1 [Stylonychia lemnae]|uniref:Queuine trna-ribosyltransferase subunit qtrtd1 n=1 Tax=Stylonychia lemnae TaxID=5949 RepID=A0A078ALC0_STYLE|nr:queuine trna-ribosyltransferase subunit qtrtd1 [Stylonychia lemnae]|eukprot:CDW83004.1 queuine trna-ribosyltransferase subunit qtrtd1 [Stylonychia lemnae]